jgi:hypothetical protein
MPKMASFSRNRRARLEGLEPPTFGFEVQVSHAQTRSGSKSFVLPIQDRPGGLAGENQLPISPAPPRSILDFGDAYRRNGQAAESRECYNQAMALVPGHAAAALKLAELDIK